MIKIYKIKGTDLSCNNIAILRLFDLWFCLAIPYLDTLSLFQKNNRSNYIVTIDRVNGLPLDLESAIEDSVPSSFVDPIKGDLEQLSHNWRDWIVYWEGSPAIALFGWIVVLESG